MRFIFESRNIKRRFAVLQALVLIFFVVFFLGTRYVSAETFTECTARKVAAGDSQATAETNCAYLSTATLSPISTSTIESYNYYEKHGTVDPATGQVVYAGASNQTTSTPTNFTYTLLGDFPGFSTNDLPTLVLGLYKFGIWTIGIAALFMMVVGGFMYMTSAGNTSNASSAKGIIWDSLLGVVAAMCAYLLLYVINPDLTKINFSFTPAKVEQGIEGTPMGSGECKTAAGGYCSEESLKEFYLSKGGSETKAALWAYQASRICYEESKGSQTAESGEDYCLGNGKKEPVSFGLFQINISAHDLGMNCTKAFNMRYDSAKSRNLCRVTNQGLYEACKAAVFNVDVNRNMMWEIFKSVKGWGPSGAWGVNERCRFSI